MKQIIALGGGGFGTEPRNPLLDEYVLAQSPVARPKICFIPTASGDSDNYIRRFVDGYSKHRCDLSYLSLFGGTTDNFEEFLSDKNIIYVGGGNTRNMLTLWRDWGLDKVLIALYEKGVVFAGVSAGSICWFQEGITDSIPKRLSRLECLGVLEGSNCPHYDSEPDRRPVYHQLLAAGAVSPGLAADDGVALHYIDGKLAHVVSSRPNALAYRLSVRNGEVEEEQIVPRYLKALAA